MDPNAYVITAQSLISVLLVGAAAALLWFVKKWVADIERIHGASAEAIKESFQIVHRRVDDQRDRLEHANATLADLRVELAKAATKEELGELRTHIDNRMAELLRAITSRN